VTNENTEDTEDITTEYTEDTEFFTTENTEENDFKITDYRFEDYRIFESNFSVTSVVKSFSMNKSSPVRNIIKNITIISSIKRESHQNEGTPLVNPVISNGVY
jgi:hypothetical protein